jgi:hypothetical protein
MSTGDKIGAELFEFKNNENRKDFAYWKTGIANFCVYGPDIKILFFLDIKSNERPNNGSSSD